MRVSHVADRNVCARTYLEEQLEIPCVAGRENESFPVAQLEDRLKRHGCEALRAYV